MALRRHFTDVFKVSTIFNIACDKSVIPSATILPKKINPNEQSVHQHLSISYDRHLITLPRIDKTLFSLNLDLLKISESDKSGHEYKCPSRLASRFSQMVILDKQTNKSDYHLPLANSITTTIIDPDHQNKTSEIKDPLSTQHAPMKEAKEIMRIRHKKMKKHKLKKLRKRMYFVWRKQKMTRKAKRDGIYWKEISEIKKEGEDFDAETFVKSQLEKARRGGYYINVFHSKA